MPSFRAGVAITSLRPGRAPSDALHAARAGVAATGVVEDAFVDVEPLRRGGLPRVTVRFVVPWSNDAAEDAAAWQTGIDLATATGRVAGWRDLRVSRRTRGRWVLLEGRDATWSAEGRA